MDDPVWDASTFCHNRDRLMEVDVSARLLRGVVEHRKVRWLLSRESLSPQAQRAFAARFANPTAGFVEHAIKFKTKARARKQAHDLAGTVDLQLNAIRSDPGQFVSALAEATGAIAASELPAEFKRDQWRELQDRATRMADFAHWMTAAESALGGRAGDFMEAYEHARQGAVDSAIEQDPIGEAARALAEEADWQGTATELLVELEKRVTEAVRKSQMWPGANKLCGRLRRIQAPLRTFGIVLDLDQRASGKDRARLIRIRKPERATN